MKRILRAAIDGYILVKVAPIVIGGVIVLIETSINGLDNTIALLRDNRILKESKRKA